MIIFEVVVYQKLDEDEVLLFESEGAIGLSFLVGPPGAAQSLPISTLFTPYFFYSVRRQPT